jgi:4-hydroxy-tetrahydrodipicolinate reductase
MTRIVVSGCNGKMGHEIVSIISETPDCQVAAGIDIHITGNEGFPAFVNAEEFSGEADVLIDFSHPSALSSLLELGKKRRLPLVLCTTGYSKAQVEELKAASKEIPIFYSRNMSLGINLLIELSKKAAQVLGKGFDIEIIEKHHNQKIDAPSGTALMLADEISTVLPEEPKYVYDRHSRRMKREKNEIGIHSIRGGTIVGEHDVLFAGHHETITLSHTAQSKEVFASGAVNAAIYLCGKPAGLYDMSDLLK